MNDAYVVRQLLVRVHRYIGLTLAPFLIVIAITGSIIPYYHDLERAVNSTLRVVTPLPQRPWTPHDLLDIRGQLEAQDPRSHVYSLQFPQRADESVFSRVTGAIDPSTGEPFELGYDEVFADPYTGKRLGERSIGHFSLQPEDLVGQIFYLHYAFVLPAALGMLLFGVLALVLAVESLVGFYLTFPLGSGARKGSFGSRFKAFFRRWKPSWKIKWAAQSTRLFFDTHRAFGLWLWMALLLFAVTGFALNLPGYYARVLSSFSGYAHFQEFPPTPALDKPLLDPSVDWYQALGLGQRYMLEQARAQGFQVGKPAALEYRRDLGVYFYLAHTSRDLRRDVTPNETDSPATAATLAIDARNGRFLGLQLPTGQRASNTLTSWMIALHTTSIGGLAWKVAVSSFGGLVITIVLAGVVVWWRRRR